MPTARGVGARRALIFSGLAVVVLLVVADILRRDSLIRGLLQPDGRTTTFPQRLIDDVREWDGPRR